MNDSHKLGADAPLPPTEITTLTSGLLDKGTLQCGSTSHCSKPSLNGPFTGNGADGWGVDMHGNGHEQHGVWHVRLRRQVTCREHWELTCSWDKRRLVNSLAWPRGFKFSFFLKSREPCEVYRTRLCVCGVCVCYPSISVISLGKWFFNAI